MPGQCKAPFACRFAVSEWGEQIYCVPVVVVDGGVALAPGSVEGCQITGTSGLEQRLINPVDVGRRVAEEGQSSAGPPPVGGCQSENDITLASVSSITRIPSGPVASACTSSASTANSNPTRR